MKNYKWRFKNIGGEGEESKFWLPPQEGKESEQLKVRGGGGGGGGGETDTFPI